MSKRGLPAGVQMRHESHYVDMLAAPSQTIGRKIAIDLIEPNPEQPRREIGDLTELSASIKEKGVLEPLLVKPVASTGRWMIIAGERRWRSAKLAGLKEVPCIEMDLDENSIAEIALIENLQRKDLNVWEEADGLRSLIERFGYTQEQVAQKISKSRSTVSEFMSIANLPEAIRERCKTADITSKSTLLEVARQFDDAAMNEYLDGLVNGKTTQKRQSKPASSTKDRSSALKNGSDAVLSGKTDAENVFKYEGSGPKFDLYIEFGSGKSPSRSDVLRALKQAFDAVKQEKV
ncbi:MAG: ParB/RepB/Spo0J family partition protein [Acidobacteria bacterium]|nr:ParB/RepB/Spo0J family partition protein [Acidobacteriota bacterium]